MGTLSGKVPKYYQISKEIIALIQKGDLAVGNQIPSENEIIEKYNVSNTTARKALAEIEHAGWAKRIKGRGTYVQHREVERSVNRILSFSRNMREAGLKPSTKVIGIRVKHQNKLLTINRRQYLLIGPICEIQRIRFANQVPMMKETRLISLQFCPAIQEKNLEESLYDIYENEYHIQLVSVEQELHAIMMDKRELTYFELKHPVPAFQVEGVTFCGRELILEMEYSIYRGDMYRFHVRAERKIL